MSRANLASEVNAAAAKLSPPLAIGVAQASETVTGWGPQEWMYVLTGVYLVIQALYLLWKWWREASKPDDDESDPE